MACLRTGGLLQPQQKPAETRAVGPARPASGEPGEAPRPGWGRQAGRARRGGVGGVGPPHDNVYPALIEHAIFFWFFGKLLDSARFRVFERVHISLQFATIRDTALHRNALI